MIGITEAAGARVINSDRMWHYTEGITNYDPIWPHARHPDPARARRRCGWTPPASGCRRRCIPGFDTLGTLEYIAQTGPRLHLVRAQRPDHRQGVRAVRAGAEPRSDRAQRAPGAARRVAPGAPAPVQAFVDKGVDFVSANSLRDLVSAMNDRARRAAAGLRHRGGRGHRPRPRSGQPVHQGRPDHRDPRRARSYLGDRLSRVVAPHRLTDPKAGPLIAVKLHILTRKSLGGLETDLDSRVLKADGSVVRRAVRGGRGRRFRRRRCARLPLAGGHVPRRLRLLRPGRGPGRRARHRLAKARRAEPRRSRRTRVPFSGSSTWKSVSVISESRAVVDAAGVRGR